MRIDKYLWCIRIFKSRTLATEACEGGKVKIDGRSVKPSHHINPGDIFTVQQGYIKRTFRIKALLITDFAEDITPAEEKEKLELARFASYHSKFKGMGRPTKKDRRALTQLRIKN